MAVDKIQLFHQNISTILFASIDFQLISTHEKNFQGILRYVMKIQTPKTTQPLISLRRAIFYYGKYFLQYTLKKSSCRLEIFFIFTK